MPLRRVGRRGARPRHRDLLAGRGRVHGGAEHAWRRRLGVDLDRAPPQAEHRRDVAVQRRLHRTRERGSQRRVEVAGQQHREEVHAREPVGPAPPARVHDAARGRTPPRAPILPHEAAQVGDRVLRPPAQPPAQRAEHPRHGARAVAVVRVRAVDGRHRVEHQPLDPVRVALRVGQRDLGAVGGPVERDPLGAERLPQRVDVVVGVAGRVEGAPRAERPRARARRGPGVEQVRPLEAAAAQEPGATGPALVVDDHVALPVGGIEDAQPAHAERVRGRLARPAGEHDQRRLSGAAALARPDPRRRTARRDPARSRSGRAARSSGRS